ncbi:MAG: DNA mismatch repair protein MutS [Candidatus Latescibacterota bacterium]|nr:MAG: DNA mismatch repair protein MutS [Candidatus Latescibacterota bacterium]
MYMSELTPMLEQYRKVKEQYPDALVLFRMGDFYETFFEDAYIASKVLGIVLTSRNHGKASSVPLAGIPHHALEQYLPKLVRAGYKVAVCEQVEDPKKAKGLVKREVVEVVTPGTALSEGLLEAKRPNFLVSVVPGREKYGLCVAEASTGDFKVTELSEEELWEELESIAPSEVLVPEGARELEEALRDRLPGAFLARAEEWKFGYERAVERLCGHFGVASLKGFGCEDLKEGVRAAGAALEYLSENQKGRLGHITGMSRYDRSEYMLLDRNAARNLEVLSSFQGGREGSLLALLDRTRTPMGGRKLREWLCKPLRSVARIEERLDGVEELYDEGRWGRVVGALDEIQDVERITARAACGRANARDLVALRRSLEALPRLMDALEGARAEVLLRCKEALGGLEPLAEELRRAIVDDPPVSLTEGGIIRDGYSPELDELRAISRDGKSWIAKLQAREQRRTGISSLKVGYNKVFGYYIEVTKPNLDKVPPDYIRKQTLVNAERFITPELKEYEAKVLSAEERIGELEYELFVRLREEVAGWASKLRRAADAVATVDVLASLAQVAREEGYTRPELAEDDLLEIREGRHPVVEKAMGKGQFVPNDLRIDTKDEQIWIITGPNMAGKCVAGDTLVFTDKGLLPIAELMPDGAPVGEFSEVSFRVKGPNGVAHASHFYRGGRKATVKLTTRMGYSLEGTPEHRVWVRNPDGSEGWKRLGEVSEGDVVAIERRIDLWGDETTVDILPAEGVRDARKRYKLPRKLDEDLAYVLGLLVGDGTLTYRNSVYLCTGDPFIAEEFKRIVRKLFGYEVKCKANGVDYFITSRQIRVFLENLGLGYVRAHEKSVPKSVMRAPKHIVKAFLQGLFDTDGFVENRYGNVRLSTSSPRLAKEVQLLLLNLGIIASLHVKKTSARPSYRLSIDGEDAIAFHRTVGFRLPRKRKRMDLASDKRMPNVGGIPYLEGVLKEVQRRIVAVKDKPVALKRNKSVNSIFYTYIPNGRNISYDKLDELITYCRQNGIDCPELEALSSRRYFYDRVAKVEQGEAEVYDLSVPGDHAYVADGFVSHNSTFVRQIGIIVLMAQMGSFVPAKYAHIGIVDRIFTRVGASDNLPAGESTFLVEMHEAANILHNATPKSLVLLDEVGRGTSTFDGLSLAWAIVEYLHNEPKVRARTLFATHYHELTELERFLPRVRNYNMAVREDRDGVAFLHKVVPGGCDHSYGIHVARLAGLPQKVIARAEEVLSNLEAQELDPLRTMRGRKRRSRRVAEVQMDLFRDVQEPPILKELRELNPYEMTPMQALQKIEEWWRRWGDGNVSHGRVEGDDSTRKT